ncbi:MAG: hypothetical protein CVU77_07540 [Elusimicrobia bacterium HGW-Elusimicrobia-1]|jgi:hypothetical protein|nr:MAG: hypothetical protein CVU77_07540 [Elusimicrobia bacterium HGW-Elusimicrobia-1]
MYKVFMLFSLLVFSGCATTLTMSPVEHRPSVLIRNPTKVSYYIHPDIHQLQAKRDTVVEKTTVVIGKPLSKSIKDMMDGIFYQPKELEQATGDGIVIVFKLGELHFSEDGSDFRYKSSMIVQVFNNKVLKEDRKFYGDSDSHHGLPHHDSHARIKGACYRAWNDVIEKVGEFFMTYKP